MYLSWTCGASICELGLRTGKAVWSLYDLSNIFLDPSLARDACVVPCIAPCMGNLHYDPVSDESLALMKGWIDNCRHGHQLCMQMPQQVGGPKRLLQCLSDGSVRLVETRSATQRCGYIALSYCWGDGNNVKKTMEEGPNKTLDLHQRGIPNKDLPPLFQEVVALARGVNIPYLWIDSLCIIQDSQEDKEEEMKQMSDIYRGALVVVVAAWAESPLDSLRRRVKPQPGQSDTWRTASLIRYEEMDLDVKFRKRGWEVLPHRSTDATYDTPIARRAWCFQEKLLASRCLVFQRDEVVWECRSCCLCECSGDQEHLEDMATVRMSRYKQMLLPFAGELETWTAFAQLPFAEHEPFDGPLKYFADAEAAYSFWKTAVGDCSKVKTRIDGWNRPSAGHLCGRFDHRRSHGRSLLGWTVEERPASWIVLVFR